MEDDDKSGSKHFLKVSSSIFRKAMKKKGLLPIPRKDGALNLLHCREVKQHQKQVLGHHPKIPHMTNPKIQVKMIYTNVPKVRQKLQQKKSHWVH